MFPAKHGFARRQRNAAVHIASGNHNEGAIASPSPAFTWWFTGLPGAGKTTLANTWADYLKSQNRPAVVLDGDELRRGLSNDLGFSVADRNENMRRVAEIARLLNRENISALVALVSPTSIGRCSAREIVGSARFIEIHVSTPLAVCQQRDPKGLYRRAANNEQFQLTGVQAPYEPPEHPDLMIDTSQMELSEVIQHLHSVLKMRSAK